MPNYKSNLVAELTKSTPSMNFYLEVEKQLEHKLLMFKQEWRFDLIRLAYHAFQGNITNMAALAEINRYVGQLRTTGIKNYDTFKHAADELLKMIEEDLDSDNCEEIMTVSELLNSRITQSTHDGFTHALEIVERLRALSSK